MNLDEKILKITDFIKEELPNEARDLADALGFIELSLDSIYDNVAKKINETMNSQQLEKTGLLLTNLQYILDIKYDLEKYLTSLIDPEDIENEIIDDIIDEEGEQKHIPDYDLYQIDSSIPHSLTENFIYTKACGFSFNNEFKNARNMRDILVKLCSILAEIDIEKMESFLNDKTMKGTKISYFSTELHLEINPKNGNEFYKNRIIPKTNLYVWVHLSCNDIKKLILKLLKKYNINQNSVKIYLRADFKELHKNNTAKNTIIKGDKIGEYVFNIFEKLSKSKFIFTENQLLDMQSDIWTKKIFGFSLPLLKKYDEKEDIQLQIKVNGNNRYWKTIFKLNGQDYFVVSQWYEYHRDKFKNFLNEFNINEDDLK